MKHIKNPFEILKKETTAIEELYEITIWCYKNISLLNIQQEENGKLTLLTDDNSSIKSYSNRGHLKSELLKKRAKELRSVLYVRLISALEVFLIDSVKYAFIKNPFIFVSQSKQMSVPYSKLLRISNISDLQWEIVEKEARSLHSGGFKDIIKYYNSQMKINIADLGINLSNLERFHDRRHLLVHRLGQTDNGYRHKYNEKSSTIKVDETELKELIQAIRELSMKLNNAIETQIANTIKPNSSENFVAKIIFELNAEILPPILLESYSFVIKDRYLRNSDLFKMEIINPNRKYAMHVNCDSRDYTLIKSVLARLERRNVIKIESLPKNRKVKPKLSNLSKDHLIRIAKMLPPRNLWVEGMHKNLALILGISNTKASGIITSILEEKQLSDMLGTDINPELNRSQQI